MLDTREEARFVFRRHYEPDAAPGRLAQLIERTEREAEGQRELLLLLRALEHDPQWRLALLASDVEVAVWEPSAGNPEPVRTYTPARLSDGVDKAKADEVLARAAERVKAEGGPAIADPRALLAKLRPECGYVTP